VTALPSTEAADALLRVSVAELARLCDEERLAVGKFLIAAAYAIAPKDRGEFRKESPGPMSLALANLALDLVNLLLRNDLDRDHSAWWHQMRAIQEQQDATGEHGLH
jgi:hypothetical protein